MLTSQSLALLAGIHALGGGCFQIALAVKLREDRPNLVLLTVGGLVSLCVGMVFSSHFPPSRPAHNQNALRLRVILRNNLERIGIQTTQMTAPSFAATEARKVGQLCSVIACFWR